MKVRVIQADGHTVHTPRISGGVLCMPDGGPIYVGDNSSGDRYPIVCEPGTRVNAARIVLRDGRYVAVPSRGSGYVVIYDYTYGARVYTLATNGDGLYLTRWVHRDMVACVVGGRLRLCPLHEYLALRARYASAETYVDTYFPEPVFSLQ